MNVRRFRACLATPVALVISLLLLLPAPAALAGAPFSPAQTIASGFGGAEAVHAADLDGDGDLDVLCAASVADTIAWWENTAGDGSAWTQHIIATAFDFPRSVYAADLDGDGDLDVLAAAESADTIAWWENTAGDGSAWTQHIVTGTLNSAVWVYAADVDGDGDLDVLGAGYYSATIAWWENTAGDGSAWTQHTLSAAFNDARAVYAADLDGDGDTDVLGTAWLIDTIAWWENTAGDGSAWTQHIVTSTFDGAWTVYAGDVDGDGDLDILGTASAAQTIAWWENTAGDGSAWTKHTVTNTLAGATLMHAADVDGDGDLDVLGTGDTANTIAWWENTAGDGSAWTQHILSSAFLYTRSVYAADLDGDGDLDVLGTAISANTIAWWENETIHRSAAYPPAGMHVVDGAFYYAQDAHAADVDGDGDMDVLGAAYGGGTIAWWENTAGDGSAWTEHVVSSTFFQAWSVYAADVDGDGDMDALGAADGVSITWWENTAGDGSAWTQHAVSSAFYGESVYAADVDGDGDMDVLGASPYTDSIAWYENTVGDGSIWVEHIVSSAFTDANSVYAADVDGDGDMDVLGAAIYTNTIAWWENTAGDGSAWTQHIVSSTFAYADSVYAADVDGDGDLDVLGAAWNDNTIAWFENTAGDGTAWTQHTVSSTFAGAYSVYAADVDGDGDMDVLGAAVSADTIAWWENTAGDGSAWTYHVVNGAFLGAKSVGAADLDGDGDPDVVGAASDADTIAWWENLGGQFALATANTAPAEIVSGLADDLLKVTMTHLGRPGDGNEEWATAALLFEDESGYPLESGQANNLIDTLAIYLDDGSGAFEPAADTLVTTVDTLALAQGVQTVAFADGDPNVQVAYGAPRAYFVVVELTPYAWYQLFGQLRVTHLTDPAAGPIGSAEDRDHDLGLSLEYAANTASGVVSQGALADLAIVKTASAGLVVPGQPITYTLAYTNYGPSTASYFVLPTGTVIISDAVPAILTKVAYTATDPALTPWPGITYTWSLWHLHPGEGGVITITGVVDPALSDAQPITNAAAIGAYPPDPVPANNTASTTGVVEIPIAGLAAANSGPTTLGQPTAFTATVASGSNVVYAWAFGDGQYGSGPAAGHTYAAAGFYTAVVTAANSVGNAAAATVAAISNLPPVAYEPGVPLFAWVGDPVMLDGSGSADPDGHYPLTYGWTQTAGPPVALSDPHAAQPTFIAPDTPATLAFLLVVTDSYGLADPTPAAWTVLVEDTPIGGLSLSSNSPTGIGRPTTFTATVESGSNVLFVWDWGEGVKSAGRAPDETVVVSHTYAAAGSYVAAVTAANGSTSLSVTTTVEITAPPACLVPLTGAGLAGLAQAYVDLTWFFTATVEPAGPTAPITYTWSPEPAGGQGAAVAAYSWAVTGPVTITVLAENCGGHALASLTVDVMSEITTPVDPGMTTTIVYTDPQVVTTTIIVPPGATPVSITLVFTPNPTPTYPISEGLSFAGHSFDLDAYLGQQLLPGYVFSRPISVAVTYTDQDVAAIQEAELKLYYWTGSAWADGATTCSPPSAYSHDLALNRIAVEICHLTEWNIQGPDSLHIVYLPLILKGWVTAPDLVVERIDASAENVQVVIRNQGTAPVTAEFWVDFYVDPSPPPTRANQTWDQLGDQGLVWGIGVEALPLAPGEAITLTVGDPYYWAEYSYVDWPLPAGAALYAQVDSAGDQAYGGVLELDEIRGEPYNNILGPSSP